MCSKDCLISSIDMLRNSAWEHALKYRYDPLIGKIYEKQLENLNILLEQAKEVTHENIR